MLQPLPRPRPRDYAWPDPDAYVWLHCTHCRWHRLLRGYPMSVTLEHRKCVGDIARCHCAPDDLEDELEVIILHVGADQRSPDDVMDQPVLEAPELHQPPAGPG